jgi:hypothetical protein
MTLDMGAAERVVETARGINFFHPGGFFLPPRFFTFGKKTGV